MAYALQYFLCTYIFGNSKLVCLLAIMALRRTFLALILCMKFGSLWLSSPTNFTSVCLSCDGRLNSIAFSSTCCVYDEKTSLKWHKLFETSQLDSSAHHTSLKTLFSFFGIRRRYNEVQLFVGYAGFSKSPVTHLLLFCLLFIAGVEQNPGPVSAAALDQPVSVFTGFAQAFALPTLQRVSAVSIIVPSDGHCFIHALSASLQSQFQVGVSYDYIIRQLRNEVIVGENIYFAFYDSNLNAFHNDALNYFCYKYYNATFGNMLPLIAANAFDLTIISCPSTDQAIADCNIVQPNKSSSRNGHYVVLHLPNDHYSGIGLLPKSVSVVPSVAISAYSLSTQYSSTSASCSSATTSVS